MIRGGKPQEERAMDAGLYQAAKDIAALQAQIVELRAELAQARQEARETVDQAEEHIWKTLKRLGICHYQDHADDYVLGAAFKAKK